MKITISSVLIVLTLIVSANDGVYYMRGGIIYPLKETKISIEKEILSFTCENKIARVDVQLEFNNPEIVERKLLLGFQAVGGFSYLIDPRNRISGFRIMQDEKSLPYQLKYARCADCELQDTVDFNTVTDDDLYFVYLFEVTFKPGINRISHSYNSPASYVILIDALYDYVLTTGSKWAGGTIKNLNVNINMGYNKYFFVNDIFGKEADWSIIGSGKISNEKRPSFGEPVYRMVRILSGTLQISVTNFKPENDIEFGIVSESSFMGIPYSDEPPDYISLAVRYLTLEPPEEWAESFSKEELKILRNAVYAQYGYAFKDKALYEYFSKFEWYMPDPNLTLEQIVLTEREKKFINEITEKEKIIAASPSK